VKERKSARCVVHATKHSYRNPEKSGGALRKKKKKKFGKKKVSRNEDEDGSVLRF